jgi:hypothetical protein
MLGGRGAGGLYSRLLLNERVDFLCVVRRRKLLSVDDAASDQVSPRKLQPQRSRRVHAVSLRVFVCAFGRPTAMRTWSDEQSGSFGLCPLPRRLRLLPVEECDGAVCARHLQSGR